MLLSVMKKLSSINWISFKEDKIYLEDIPVIIGENIDEFLTNNLSLKYAIETAEYNEKRKYINFDNYSGIIVSIYDTMIDNVSVYPYEYQSSPYYKGDIFILDKKLKVPFLSDDIEQYFPDISIKPTGYFKRFSPRETIDYPVNDTLKIEISMGRDPELVSSLSLKNR